MLPSKTSSQSFPHYQHHSVLRTVTVATTTPREQDPTRPPKSRYKAIPFTHISHHGWPTNQRPHLCRAGPASKYSTLKQEKQPHQLGTVFCSNAAILDSKVVHLNTERLQIAVPVHRILCLKVCSQVPPHVTTSHRRVLASGTPSGRTNASSTNLSFERRIMENHENAHQLNW